MSVNDRRLSNSRGFSLVELMIVVAIMSFVGLVTARLLSLTWYYFRATSLRNQLWGQAVSCQNTIRRFLELGSAHTVIIDSLDTTGLPCSFCPPNSHITFNLASPTPPTPQTQYQFYVTGDSIQMQVGTRAPMELAGPAIPELHFVVPDPSVPNEVLVTLRLQAPIDARRTATVALTDQLVQMAP